MEPRRSVNESPHRHEAPLTAAQLYTDMEKEQESVVCKPSDILVAYNQDMLTYLPPRSIV